MCPSVRPVSWFSSSKQRSGGVTHSGGDEEGGKAEKRGAGNATNGAHLTLYSTYAISKIRHTAKCFTSAATAPSSGETLKGFNIVS